MANKEGTTVVFESEEEKAAAFKARKNEAAKRMLQRKAEAMKKLIDLALREGNEEERKAAQYLLPHPVGPRAPKNEVVEYVMENGPQSEDQIWMKFKLGRTEMKRVLKSNTTLKCTDGVYHF